MSDNSKIKEFLKRNFPNDYDKLFYTEHKIYNELIQNINNKTKNQIKTLKNIILPRISLYKTFLENNYNKDVSLEWVQKLINEKGKRMNRLYKKISKIPFSKYLFLKMMKSGMTKNDNWNTETIKETKNELQVNILKCLWYDSCIENNCEELCKYFCDVDNIIYENIQGINFHREGTLFYGNKCCDFKFIRS